MSTRQHAEMFCLDPDEPEIAYVLPVRTQCAVSVLIFTLDEELNLEHCLNSLTWSDDVVVVDSFSTDGTLGICAAYGIRTVQHAFSGFGDQRNWALQTLDLKHEWVLLLDADEKVTPELAEELNELARTSPEHVAAYRIKRRFHMWGRWLRYSSLYPTWVVRFVRRGRVRFANRGHAETQEVDGDSKEINGYLIDENHKSLEAWFERQSRYARQEALFELESEAAPHHFLDVVSADPMRRRASLKRIASRLPFRNILYFVYCYVLRLGFLDGADGLRFCRMKAMYQSMIVTHKQDIKLGRTNSEPLEETGAEQ